jgi:uncharacterized protein YjbJ (UPF0337 family)
MNWDQIEGKWKQAVGKIKEKWGELTDNDLQAIGGKRDQLVGKIQERYGIAKDEAERQVNLQPSLTEPLDWMVVSSHFQVASAADRRPVFFSSEADCTFPVGGDEPRGR